MNKHSEKSAIRYLLRKGAKEHTDENEKEIITISVNNIGNGTLGVIDYLRKYCKRTIKVDYGKNLVKKGKFLSLVLRHRPEAIGIELDANGWANVDELVNTGNWTKELLEEIVRTNNKQRHEFNENKTKIRARQGHSIDVDVELKEICPPPYLYHGTSEAAIDSIFKTGIEKRGRLHVHLTGSIKAARKSGSRWRGKPNVIEVRTLDMHNDGYKFFVSNNDVFLVEHVPTKYISLIPMNISNIVE